MATLYAAVGIVGYWSRGESITGIVIFSLGDSPRIRFAAGLILIQATSQYLVSRGAVHVVIWIQRMKAGIEPPPPLLPLTRLTSTFGLTTCSR